MFFRYYSGNNVIGYDTCDSTASASTQEHKDFRPNYCPTKTRKMTITSPSVDQVEDWNITAIEDRVYAVQYYTTPSE